MRPSSILEQNSLPALTLHQNDPEFLSKKKEKTRYCYPMDQPGVEPVSARDLQPSPAVGRRVPDTTGAFLSELLPWLCIKVISSLREVVDLSKIQAAYT